MMLHLHLYRFLAQCYNQDLINLIMTVSLLHQLYLFTAMQNQIEITLVD